MTADQHKRMAAVSTRTNGNKTEWLNENGEVIHVTTNIEMPQKKKNSNRKPKYRMVDYDYEMQAEQYMNSDK